MQKPNKNAKKKKKKETTSNTDAIDVNISILKNAFFTRFASIETSKKILKIT
jgi:hypothetical protein